MATIRIRNNVHLQTTHLAQKVTHLPNNVLLMPDTLIIAANQLSIPTQPRHQRHSVTLTVHAVV